MAAHVLPALSRLHERHLGVSQELNASFVQAAFVCLSEHHSPPLSTFSVLRDGAADDECDAEWTDPGDRARAAWANSDDAVRDGAYAVAISAVELFHGYFALARAEQRTGADYYVGPPGDLSDLESVLRLEVSGVISGGESAVKQRLKEKVDQIGQPDLNGPALACVVGFRVLKILTAPLV